jgi:hypothetical protein
MTVEDFRKVVNKQLDICESILLIKAKEYADDEDRLHNFVVASELQGVTLEEALGGLMAKHTVSIYDMIRGVGNEKVYPMDMWDEKITDHINYLLLLKAIVTESNQEVPQKSN